MSGIFACLNPQHRMRVLVLSLVCVVLLGLMDYLTGYEISFFVLCLLPVALVSWYVGRPEGILVPAASTAKRRVYEAD